MMDPRSVFHEEWLRSLREQFKHVVRNNDRGALSSLTAVMQKIGFRDAELAQLRIEATMHVDDVGEDYSPDMSILKESIAAQAHPAECVCPECMTVDESQFDEEGQPIAPDPEANDYERNRLFPVADSSEIEEPEETESVTFEDSVAAEALNDDQAESGIADAEDEGEGDPDAPAQMSLF